MSDLLDGASGDFDESRLGNDWQRQNPEFPEENHPFEVGERGEEVSDFDSLFRRIYPFLIDENGEIDFSRLNPEGMYLY